MPYVGWYLWVPARSSIFAPSICFHYGADSDSGWHPIGGSCTKSEGLGNGVQ